MSITKLATKTIKTDEFAAVNFDATVINAGVALQGFEMSFGASVDHHVREIVDESKITYISGLTVGVTAIATMEDNSNHFAKGDATVLVIAECNV